MISYPYGTRVNVQATFRDPLTNAPVDPTTVEAHVRRPDGATTIYEYPATIARVGAGIYRIAHATDMPGEWQCRWEAGGNRVGAGERKFSIRESAWYP